MAERGDNNFMRYVYRGEEGEIIPRGATHIFVHESVTVIRARAFKDHPNIVEVICHDKIEKIERFVFFRCRRLRRVIIPGVTIVERLAFDNCDALTDVECDKLEIIGFGAFSECTSLRSIDLPSAWIVEDHVFGRCEALTDVTFGTKLERFGQAFYNCKSLERITIPLKNGLITADDTFQGCHNLKLLELVDEGRLYKTIAALHLKDWRNDVNDEIYSIYGNLPNADDGEKAVVIRSWIRSLLSKIVHYTAEHRRLLDEVVMPTLQPFLPQDIVMINVLPFFNLPPLTSEVGHLA